jgi:hypothetical protein
VKNVPHIEGPRNGGAGRTALSLVVLMALLGTLPLMAQQARIFRDGRSWVEETNGTLPASRVLRISTDIGSVKVQGGAPTFRWVIKKHSWAGSQAEAKDQFDRYKVRVYRTGDAAVLEMRRTTSLRGNRFSVEMYLEVPREMDSIRIETQAGNIGVNGTTARLELSTQGGNVSADDIGGAVRVTTLGGDVKLGTLHSDAYVHSGGGNVQLGNVQGRIEVNTMGGNVTVAGMAGGTVQTGAGCIDVRQSRGDLRAISAGGTLEIGEVKGKAVLQSGGGNIKLGMGQGPVVANTAGGNIELWKLFQGAQVQTGAGAVTVEFVGNRGSFTNSMVHTAAGDVVVYLNGGMPVTVHAASELASGKGVSTDFPELKITTEGGKYGPRTVFADGSINGGGQVLKVRTTIGQIEIKKAKQ